MGACGQLRTAVEESMEPPCYKRHPTLLEKPRMRQEPHGEENDKYWCRRLIIRPCVKIVENRGSKSKKEGRMSIRDHPALLSFIVTMRNLTVEDEGTYWCGIALKWLKDGAYPFDPAFQAVVSVSPGEPLPHSSTRAARTSSGQNGWGRSQVRDLRRTMRACVFVSVCVSICVCKTEGERERSPKSNLPSTSSTPTSTTTSTTTTEGPPVLSTTLTTAGATHSTSSQENSKQSQSLRQGAPVPMTWRWAFSVWAASPMVDGHPNMA
ncbi:LOW QUALITY PROTEIN: CMRF35-like molecule 8 [Trichechus manatus latirostris]|uniref:LOW QUALITY PROTEIN: CMRF35-like molecule 8 n=1 Tax=Trichechus manatus latirostris TaxID=127582 RepID=A0A2Y9R0S3_TRIMA|nr:LOW QUALITY PROTEIN: CMRF35-like molecule 8 [Trichechus manatus latirostris]